MHHCNSWRIKIQLDVTCYFISLFYVLNMFRTLIYCWRFGVVGFWVVPMLQAEAAACNTGTTQNQPHQNSNTQRTENKTTDVVIQQHSCKLLMMDILMSETCWAHKKWNKIASDIKLVFYSSNSKWSIFRTVSNNNRCQREMARKKHYDRPPGFSFQWQGVASKWRNWPSGCNPLGTGSMSHLGLDSCLLRNLEECQIFW